MANLNRVFLIGNLTRDPECRYTPKGTAVCEIGLAVNRVWNDDQGQRREECCFIDVTFWSKQAETIGQYCTKGKSLFVEGRLQLDTWDDRETGQKRTKLRVVGENFQFLGGPKDDSGTSERRSQSTASPRKGQVPAPPTNARPEQNPGNMGYAGEDEDCPF